MIIGRREQALPNHQSPIPILNQGEAYFRFPPRPRRRIFPERPRSSNAADAISFREVAALACVLTRGHEAIDFVGRQRGLWNPRATPSSTPTRGRIERRPLTTARRRPSS